MSSDPVKAPTDLWGELRGQKARIEALEAENAQLREDRNRYERQICAAEHGHTVNDVLANYRQIRRAIQDRRAREGGNADG